MSPVPARDQTKPLHPCVQWALCLAVDFAHTAPASSLLVPKILSGGLCRLPNAEIKRGDSHMLKPFASGTRLLRSKMHRSDRTGASARYAATASSSWFTYPRGAAQVAYSGTLFCVCACVLPAHTRACAPLSAQSCLGVPQSAGAVYLDVAQ